MTFIRNLWYVAAWSHELDGTGPIGRVVIEEPLVLNRKVDSRKSYRFVLPGLFLLDTDFFAVGTAAASDFGPPPIQPIFRRREEQAVTPVDQGRSRYLYASGVEAKNATPHGLESRLDVINAAFAEDKRMIEAQQRIWDLTPPNRQKTSIPQDKAPAQFRRLIARRLALEAGAQSFST